MKIVKMDKKIFEKAFELCTQELNSDYIFETLKQNDDIEKQIAILQIAKIETKDQASLLIQHLTGQDGPVREAAAVKIKELILEKNTKLLDDVKFYDKYSDAVCDVNPNICRAVIDFLPVLDCQKEIIDAIIDKTKNVFTRIENPDLEQKNFLTVRLFNLYWCLEALSCFESKTLCEWNTELEYILTKAVSFSDYTINEKVAKILTKITNIKNEQAIKERLREADNFYVKRYLRE